MSGTRIYGCLNHSFINGEGVCKDSDQQHNSGLPWSMPNSDRIFLILIQIMAMDTTTHDINIYESLEGSFSCPIRYEFAYPIPPIVHPIGYKII